MTDILVKDQNFIRIRIPKNLFKVPEGYVPYDYYDLSLSNVKEVNHIFENGVSERFLEVTVPPDATSNGFVVEKKK
jgi:hypothetical protein